MGSVLFSIITPTFNRGYCIWKAIQSIQKQIYPFWELLVVDDGSSDNTALVVAEFQKDPRIKYFKLKEHTSGCIARNFGLDRAKGEIITYLDSDDTVYENFLSTALEYLEKNPKKVFAIPNYNRRIELYDKNFRLLDFTKVSSAQKTKITLRDFFHWKVKTCGTGIFHRRSVLRKGIRWDPEIKRAQDWDFIMQLGTKFPNGFIHIPYVLYEYLQKYGGDSMCSNGTYLDWADCFEKMYQKHKNSHLMKGQKWYPQRIKKYKRLQELFEKGKAVPPAFRYFPYLYQP